MRISMTSLTAVTVVALGSLVVQPGCARRDEGTDRWATTENTNVAIDWDKVNEAYRLAEGPEDFEERVNQIYEGDELISIAVQDLDGNQQVVTGFFDKNSSGSVDEAEKIFTIKREITGEGTAQYETTGHGHYGYYHSPMLSIVSGMMIGSMLSNAFRPSYVPVHTQPYTTSAQRAGQLRANRSGYRAANPSKFARPKASRSGRSYGTRGGRSGGGFRGGGRFGIRRREGAPRPERLTA